MTHRTWLCYLGGALLLSASPVISTSAQAAPAQSAQASTPKKKSKSAKTKAKPRVVGQKAPTPDRIREIQSALKRENAFDGEPTGKWDDAMTSAMKKYQEAQGMNPSGKIDALTLQKLGLGSQTAGKGAPIPLASSADPHSNPSR
jgi:peptidoglycan hydrolase-like protein with peptidoglycan-binding domain